MVKELTQPVLENWATELKVFWSKGIRPPRAVWFEAENCLLYLFYHYRIFKDWVIIPVCFSFKMVEIFERLIYLRIRGSLRKTESLEVVPSSSS